MKPLMLGVVALVLAAGLLAACQRSKAPQRDAAAAAAKPSAPAVAGPERLVLALGDSLFAGYDLRPEQAYPVRLEAALRARGINARVVNAGVSGDTTADGRARLAFSLASLPRRPDLVLLSLGGNDMLRGLPVAQTRENLDAILGELEKRKVRVVVMGMLAMPNLGKDYGASFNAVFPAVAAAHRATLVPFFLKAVIDRPDLRLEDRMHPTAKGIEAMVADTAGVVGEVLARDGAPDA
ncbi:MAG: arylesterase [Sphingomonadales bacterium]|nr:arylesterase [Sphingomonadales bacterium]